MIETGKKVTSYRGKWDFLNRLKPGDSFMLDTEQEYMNARYALRHKRMKHIGCKQRDGSGWRVLYVGDTAGQL